MRVLAGNRAKCAIFPALHFPKRRSRIKPKQEVKRRMFHMKQRIRTLYAAEILPNPAQPRRVFSEGPLRELSESIREYGVLQPLVVRKVDGGWELVAGERRLRAARLAGLERVPCVEVEADDRRSSVLALIENIQRRDLDFVEQAEGIKRLIDTYQFSQEEAAARLGLSQSAVANKLRVLRLDAKALGMLRRAGCGERHARALLKLESAEMQQSAAATVVERGLNVADTEALVERMLAGKPEHRLKRKRIFVLKDVRIFLNTVREAVGLMRTAGLDASADEREEGDELIVTVRIPKKREMAR